MREKRTGASSAGMYLHGSEGDAVALQRGNMTERATVFAADVLSDNTPGGATYEGESAALPCAGVASGHPCDAWTTTACASNSVPPASHGRDRGVCSPMPAASREVAAAAVHLWFAGERTAAKDTITSCAGSGVETAPTPAEENVDGETDCAACDGGAEPWIAWQTPSRIVLAAAAPACQRAILKDALVRNLEANEVRLHVRDMNALLALPMDAVLAAITSGPAAEGEAARVLREHLAPLRKRPGTARRL